MTRIDFLNGMRETVVEANVHSPRVLAKTFTLVQILESAINCFKTGLAEAAEPRNNEGDACRCWFEGTALLNMDAFGWNAVRHNWSNEHLEPEDRLTDEERAIFQQANDLYTQLHSELERLWAAGL